MMHGSLAAAAVVGVAELEGYLRETHIPGHRRIVSDLPRTG